MSRDPDPFDDPFFRPEEEPGEKPQWETFSVPDSPEDAWAEEPNPYAAPVEPAPPRPAVRGDSDAPWHKPELASRLSRLAAYLIDVLATFIGAAPGFMFMVLLTGVSGQLESDEEDIGLFFMLLGIFVVSCIQWYFIATRGQSFGKMALRIRIAQKDDYDIPGFVKGVVLRAWVPNLINAFCCRFFLVIDALWILGEEKRCIHDQIADTVVITLAYDEQFL